MPSLTGPEELHRIVHFMRELYALILRGLSFKEAFYSLAPRLLRREEYFLAYKISSESLKRIGRVSLLARDLVSKYHDLAMVYAVASLAVLVEENVIHIPRELLRKYDVFNRLEDSVRWLYDHISNLRSLDEYSMTVEYSLPRWLVRRLMKLLGPREACELMGAMNKRTYWIRVNTLKCSVEAAMRRLEALDVEVEEDTDFPILLRIRKGNIKRIILSPLVRKGLVFLQDKASVAVVYALKPEPGERILDACAAPGMKTTLIAQLMENRGFVVAVDLSARRLAVLRKILKRAGVKIVEPLHADSRKLPSYTCFDKVLVDAPCTSSGAIAADPSLRLRLERVDILRYSTIQRALLRFSLSMGNTVVYSVCSLLPEEGEEIIDSLISKLKLLPVRIPGNTGYPGYKCSNQVRRLFPHKHQTLGFFIARVAPEVC